MCGKHWHGQKSYTKISVCFQGVIKVRDVWKLWRLYNTVGLNLITLPQLLTCSGRNVLCSGTKVFISPMARCSYLIFLLIESFRCFTETLLCCSVFFWISQNAEFGKYSLLLFAINPDMNHTCIVGGWDKEALRSLCLFIRLKKGTQHLHNVYYFSMHLNVMWTVFMDARCRALWPLSVSSPSGRLTLCMSIHSACVITLCVLANGCLNRCGSHISPLISCF